MRSKCINSFIMLVLVFIQLACLSVYADDPRIVFTDENFEKAVRSAINKPSGDILISDAEKVTEINANRRNIINIEGIQYFKNIKKLILSSNDSLYNIDQLKDLKYLTELQLGHTKVKDVSVLNTLSSLEILDIRGTSLSNIDINLQCNNLKKLIAVDNQIRDISGLSNCKNLEYIDLGNNRISNLTPLEDLTKLTYLDLYRNNVSDIKALANKPNLAELNIIFNNLTNIDALSNLNNLKSLNLKYNNIEDINGLSKLTNLTELLVAEGNNITDFSPTKGYYYALKMKDFHLADKQVFDLDNYTLEPIRYPINLNGTDFKSEKPLLHLSYGKKDFLYLPLQEVSQSLGYKLLWNNTLSRYEMTKDIDGAKVIKQNPTINKLTESKSYLAKPMIHPLYADGKKYLGAQPLLVIEIDDKKYEYICIQGLSDIIDIQLTWNNNLKQMDIKYVGDNESILIEKQLKAEFDYSDLNGKITVSGRITDINNKPIENASVVLINLSYNTNMFSAYPTDKKGEYIASGLVAGDYKVRVIADEGYKPSIVFKTIESNMPKLDIQMQKSPNDEVNWMKIKWQKKETNRFVLYYTKGDEITDREVQYLEDHLSIMERFLSTNVNNKIQYYLFPNNKAVREKSGQDVEAFANADTINSPYMLHYHELAHVIINAFYTETNNGIHEGLARFLGSGKLGSPVRNGKPLDDQAKELMKNDDLASIYSMLIYPINYDENASFITFILKKYDLYQFKQLVKRIPTRMEFDKDKESPIINSAFWDIYNKTPFQLYNEWRIYLGGTPVNSEADTFERYSVIQATIDIEGLTSEDLLGKHKNLRTELYKDIKLTNNIASGIDDLYKTPQNVKLAYFIEADGYLLIYADWNQNCYLDKGEYSAVIPVSLNYKKPMKDLHIILKKN